VRYELLSEKMFRLWLWLSNTQNEHWSHCKWFFKIDDDSVLNIDFILNRLRCLDDTEEIYT
jgi:hypothetical protein